MAICTLLLAGIIFGATEPRPLSTAAPARPDVLFLGPLEGAGPLYDLMFSILVENGVYIESDANDKLPTELPADLSPYKVIILRTDVPLEKDPAVKARLEAFAKEGRGVIHHTPPKTINWETNDPELYQVYDVVTKKYGVRTQNPAFLERNASRPDQDVILGTAEAMTQDKGLERWYLIGNDVAYIQFGALLAAAEVYECKDIRQWVVDFCNRLLKEKGQQRLPVFRGPLLTWYVQPGFEECLKKALSDWPPADDLAKLAKGYTTCDWGINDETLEGMGYYGAYGDLFHKPEYFQPAIDMMTVGYKFLFNPQTKLWAHGWDNKEGATPAWSRGHGWMLYGLVGLIQHVPKDHPGYPVLVKMLTETAEGLRRFQDPQTGLWHNIIDDPATRLEASGTAMIVRQYCRAWQAGVCRTPEMKEMLTRAWWGLKAHTFDHRTFSFLWGMGASHDKSAYSLKPSSGTRYPAVLAGAEYVKTFGPLVKEGWRAVRGGVRGTPRTGGATVSAENAEVNTPTARPRAVWRR